MELTKFAEKHRLKVKRDPEDGTQVIVGGKGQIYEFSSDELAVMFIPGGDPRTRQWHTVRENCLAVGMTLQQDGDAEGAFSFDPENQDQAKLAIKVAGAKGMKRLSDQHRGKLVGAGVRFGENQTSLQSTSEV